MPKGAKNIENAKTFMNFLMHPENMAMLSNFACKMYLGLIIS